MSETTRIPEEICDLTNSMKIYGLEYSYDADNKVLKIKGKLKSINRFGDRLYITIRNKRVNIEYAEYGDGAMITFTINNKLGTETVLNQIMLKKKPHVYYDSGCLNLMFED